MKKNNNIKSIDNNNYGWFEKPFNFYMSLVVGFLTIFGIGYGIGIYKKNLEQELENIKIEQGCNEKVTAEKEKCSEYRRKVEEEKISNLTATVNELKKIQIANSDEK